MRGHPRPASPTDTWSQVPAVIGRSESTLPKIVDEYFWVTITRGFSVPNVSPQNASKGRRRLGRLAKGG
jgi:hypothetical protein